MHTIRKTSGIAGFPKREESVHDAFGAGHSSTSISAGLGQLPQSLNPQVCFSLYYNYFAKIKHSQT
jgi:hypothetical protein